MKHLLLTIVLLLPASVMAQPSEAPDKLTKSASLASALARSLSDAYTKIDMLEAEVAQLKAAQAIKPKDVPP